MTTTTTTCSCEEVPCRHTPVAPDLVSDVWECGPHANAWGGHDARCRRVPTTRDQGPTRARAGGLGGMLESLRRDRVAAAERCPESACVLDWHDASTLHRTAEGLGWD